MDTTQVDAGDTDRPDASPCGSCAGDTPVCDPETGDCVECLSDSDCSGDKPVCDTESSSCVACKPDDKSEFYPDEDSDGYGDAEADGTLACSAPDGMVDNAEDCDDTDEKVHPEADEVCNGQDDDCDGKGDTDDEMKARDCAKTKGVCKGATIKSCSEDGTAYATCTADQYGSAYREADDEQWRCDEADNDCDGETDEVCCDRYQMPDGVEFGQGRKTMLVPAVDEAPDGAKFLVAWTSENSNDEVVVNLQHIDASGTPVGPDATTELNTKTAFEVEAVAVNAGYGFVVSTRSAGTYRLAAFHYNAGLTGHGNWASISSHLERNRDIAYRGVDVSADDSTMWVSYRDEKNNTDRVRVAGFDTDSGQVTTGPVTVSPSNFGPGVLGSPALAVVDGTPTVIFKNSDAKVVSGARLENGSTATRFQFGTVDGFGKPNVDSVDLFGQGGKAHAVYSQVDQDYNLLLKYRAIDPSETGSLGAGTTITPPMDNANLPNAAPVDSDGDGTADQMLLLWYSESSTPTPFVGTMPLANPATITGRQIAKKYDNELYSPQRLAIRDGKAAAIFINEFLPLSIDGHPICDGT